MGGKYIVHEYSDLLSREENVAAALEMAEDIDSFAIYAYNHEHAVELVLEDYDSETVSHFLRNDLRQKYLVYNVDDLAIKTVIGYMEASVDVYTYHEEENDVADLSPGVSIYEYDG